MYKLTFEKTKGAFTKAKIYHYYELPVRKCAAFEQDAIINKVNEILSDKYSNPSADTSALESEIDRLVYQLYGLTEEEIRIVEGKKKKNASKFGSFRNSSYLCTVRND